MKTKYYHHSNTHKRKRLIRLVGGGLIFFGGLFLLYFFFPVLSYQVFLSKAFASQDMESPIPKYMVAQNNNVGTLLSQGFKHLTTDYSDARNWYPEIQVKKENNKDQIPNYTLSIPKLQIENANVSTVNYNLDETLVHYYGPKNPTNPGTSVIYGHSTIPQWFDSTDYRKIFATLHNLAIDDEIILNVEGTTYTYKVYAITITHPDDVDIFSQTYDDSYLTLVTCTPPGTTWKRLIVRAHLL